MTTTARTAPTSPSRGASATGTEHHDLGSLGYTQELHRGVGYFASFAAGFSFVSILTTVFQLFGLGFSFGGAAFFWTWPVVFAGQLLVALCFAELAARYPISGSIFQWSSRLAGTDFGWFTGWIMVVGQILTVATAAIAMQAVLPAIWSRLPARRRSGADAAPISATGAAERRGARPDRAGADHGDQRHRRPADGDDHRRGVAIEIVGVIALVVVLFFHAERGPVGRADHRRARRRAPTSRCGWPPR